MDDKDEFLEQAHSFFDDEKRLQEYTQIVERLSYFLNEKSVFEQYHPLQAELVNFAPVSVNKVASLVEMMESFENDPVFQNDILTRLNHPNQYPSTRLELEIAYFIQNSGTSVEFVDPKAEHGEQQQDLLVADRLPVEIKQLRQPSHIVEQTKYFNEITNTIMKNGGLSGFKRAGKIHRPLAEIEKNEFVEQIKDAIPHVKDGKTVEIQETSLREVDYEMFLAPYDKKNELEEWRERRNIDGSFSGPAQTQNDIVRLKRAIAAKVEQLPDDTPGVVLIEIDQWFTEDNRAETLFEVARELFRDVYDHEELSSLVLLLRNNHLDIDLIDRSYENVQITDFTTNDEIGCRTFVTIHNNFVDDPIGKEIVNSVFSNRG